jgi:hypothetical protein
VTHHPSERADALTAKAALHALKDARVVDALCALWAKGRDAQLGSIIAEQGYAARQPVEIRVLSALQAKQLSVAGESAATIPWLVQAIHDQEATVAGGANAALRSLQDVRAVDALCELAIADPTGGRRCGRDARFPPSRRSIRWCV